MKTDINEIKTRLLNNSEAKYKDFSKKLIFDDKILGVRAPFLHALAKEIAGNGAEEYLNNAATDFHEEKMLYGLVIGYARMDIEQTFLYINKWLDLCSNWAICDICVLSFKAFKKHRERVWEFLTKTLENTDEEFKIRFCIVALFAYFNDALYVDRLIDIYKRVKSEYYYVNMALSWGVCEIIIKHYEKGIALLKEKSLPVFVHNKAISKSTDSFRLSQDQKKELKELRITEKKKNGQ